MKTNKELAALVRQEITAPGCMSAGQLEQVAQRLEASSEITEAKVGAVAKTLYAQHRSIENVTLPKWDELSDFQRYAWTERARAALLAAREA